MFRTAIILFFCLSLFSAESQVQAAASQADPDTLRYVSDVLVINIRDQLEKPFSVIGVVRSGDPVRIVEEQDNYFKIETADKKQGWIGKQYLKNELPDALIVQQLRQEIVELKKQLGAMPATDSTTEPDSEKDPAASCPGLQQKLSDAEKQIQQLQEQNERKQSLTPGSPSEAVAQLEEQNLDMARQLEHTSQRYNQLVAEYEKRGKEIALLHNSIAKHDDTTRFFWFGAGAVVFFFGLLAGKTATRKKNKLMY